MSIYGLSKKVFRWLLPLKIRQKFWQEQNPLVMGLSQMKNKLATTAANNEIYDDEYFQKIDTVMMLSAPTIADSIVREFQPKSVVDVGCGTGVLLTEFGKRGVEGIGLEYADAALRKCQARGLNVRRFDIECAEGIKEKADITVSTEVAEHLPAHCADKYIDLLISISDIVVMTAAQPGQGGTDHVNEQPNEYWIAKFVQRGFCYEESCTRRLRQEWKDLNIDCWYYSNLMIFLKES